MAQNSDPAGTALVHVPKVTQPNGSRLYAGGVPGNRGGTGKPSTASKIRRQAIIERAMEEQLRLLAISQQCEVPIVKFNDLTTAIATYDDDLRTKASDQDRTITVRIVHE